MKLRVWMTMVSLGFAMGYMSETLWAQDPTPAPPVVCGISKRLDPPPPALVRRKLAPLSSNLPDSAPRSGMLPPDASVNLFDQEVSPAEPFRGGSWQKQVCCWAASELRHRPVYFEDTAVERYGQTRRPVVQSAASGARFFATFPLLPYAMTVSPPGTATSTLGFFRPGNPAPLLLRRPPLECKAGIVQAGTAVGLIFLVP